MQTASLWISTRNGEYTSNDNNRYATSAFIIMQYAYILKNSK